MTDNSNTNNPDEDVVGFGYIIYLLNNLSKKIQHPVLFVVDNAVISYRDRDKEELSTMFNVKLINTLPISDADEKEQPTTLHVNATIKIKTDINTETHTLMVSYFSDLKKISAPFIEMTYIIELTEFLSKPHIFKYNNVQDALRPDYKIINKKNINYKEVSIKKIVEKWNLKNLKPEEKNEFLRTKPSFLH